MVYEPEAKGKGKGRKESAPAIPSDGPNQLRALSQRLLKR